MTLHEKKKEKKKKKIRSVIKTVSMLLFGCAINRTGALECTSRGRTRTAEKQRTGKKNKTN
jgi:hypothetical protein